MRVKRDTKNLNLEHTRHKKAKWVYRVGHGPRKTIKGIYGTPDFWAQYEALERGDVASVPVKTASARLSVAWCLEQLFASRRWIKLAGESRKQLSYQFTKIKNNIGKDDVRKLTRKGILKGFNNRADTPSDANKYLRAMTMLCEFCVDEEWLEASPVVKIAKLATGDGEGFYTWTRDDFAKFEAHWKIGTMQRLAYEIYFNTGLRRGDVHKFGSQHINRQSEFRVKTGKTKIVVEGDITPRLARAIEATECGELTFLLTEKTKTPFQSAQSLGNWFGPVCKAAGVPGNGHGIRKGVAVILAENKMTQAQLNAFFGWSFASKESATYIARASRKTLAKEGAAILSRTGSQGAG